MAARSALHQHVIFWHYTTRNKGTIQALFCSLRHKNKNKCSLAVTMVALTIQLCTFNLIDYKIIFTFPHKLMLGKGEKAMKKYVINII